MNFTIYMLMSLLTVGAVSGINLLQFQNLYTALDLEKLAKNDGEVSPDCLQGLEEYKSALSNVTQNPWALQMLDATAKIPEGVLQGTLNDFGNFDECLAVVSASENFTGKYCMLDIKGPTNTSVLWKSKLTSQISKNTKDAEQEQPPGLEIVFSYGLCLPSSCTAEDLNNIFSNEIIASIVNVTADDHSCYTSKVDDWSPGSWALISVGIVLVVLAGFSTSYELYQAFICENEKPNRFLCAFSIYSNTIGMLEIRDSAGDMSCLHGLRTLSMMWVVLGHTFLSKRSAPLINLISQVDVKNGFDYVVIANGYFSVDSFFFLSGLLVAFVFFRNIARSGSFDVPVSYVHRYLRLTPGFIIMVLFNMTMYGELDKGPIYYKYTLIDATFCQDNWWSNLLYLQNYIVPASPCLGQSWYLSADMQMFWISPLILYPLYLWPKLGVTFLSLLTLASSLWTFVLAYVNHYRATLLMKTSDQQFTDDYVATHARMAPWLVGLALGYLICVIKAKKINIRLSKIKVACGWVFSTTVCLACLYGVLRFDNNDTATDAEHAAFLSFVRLGWGVGLAWVVFACVYGYGGIANTFLSLGIFQPLGKLSYSVFLIHQTIISYRIAISRTNGYFNNLNVVYDFLGTWILAHLFAIVMYLLLEAPVAVLDKELLGSIKFLRYPKAQKTSNVSNTRETLPRIERNT